MTPQQAGALMHRARKLLRRGQLTHRALAVLDCMVWSCRPRGGDRAAVSYTRLQKLVHISRETVSRAVRALEDLGLLRRHKRRARVIWGGSVASRQATTVYQFLPPTESAHATVHKGQEIQLSKGVNHALTALGRAISAASPSPPASPPWTRCAPGAPRR